MFLFIYKAVECPKAKIALIFFTCWNKKGLDCSFACSIQQDSIMLIQNALLFGFAFSCISAGLPETEANWQYVINDLKTVEYLLQVSTHFSIKSFI